MPKNRDRRRMSGRDTAFASTPLACTPENQATMRSIAREAVSSSCIDRMAACDHRGKVVVTASCPTRSAAENFVKKVERFGRLLKAREKR